MKRFEPFQVAHTSLERGVTLIEASAGTGKTFTITGIVLRLVLEEHIPIEQILAVTYTVAATEELRDRVRKRLRNALDDLRRGKSEDDVVAKFLKSGDVALGIREINLAVQNFDAAQIFTIHGFCQRVLRDNAFESGLLLDMELLPDPTAILEEAARDFWRQRFYEARPLLSRLALAHGRSPDTWIGLLQRIRNHPDLRILPEPEKKSCVEFSTEIERDFASIREEWPKHRDAVCEILENHKGLSRAKGTLSKENCAEIIASLTRLCEQFDESDPWCLHAVESLSTSGIQRCTKPTGIAPEHPFFEFCENFTDLTSRFFQRLDQEFIEFAQREMPLRKARLNVLTYEDLLTRLRDALKGATGEALAGALGGQYRAALIDEFQDTDPVQYEIFHRVFADGAHYLYFIGDPKQAIYAFRGADVFTYLRAASQASHAFTLGTNFRSEKPLLEAINALFEEVEKPFLMDEIEYRRVSAPKKPRDGFASLVEKMAMPPLRFRLLNTDSGTVNQTDAEELISDAVVADIARLKAGQATLGERPLKFGDMAVLVRSNRQAANMQELLRAKGIKSVLKTEDSVFETEEAVEILRLLEAVLDPGRDTLLKTALVTSFVGLGAADILELEADDAARQVWLEKFLGYRTRWEDSCFIAMFRHVLVDQNVREKLVKWPGGERRLTNVLHIAELLHGAETEQRLMPEALCAWLRKQRSNSARDADEHQLRLESDEDAVLLATVHKSKGLEYPIVFCPFLWKAADSSKREEVLFHDPEADHRLTLDLRDKKAVPEHDRLTGEERMAESLRVLYVALTRAQNRCYVYAGDISRFDGSPLAHVLGSPTALPALEALAEKTAGVIETTLIDPATDQTVKAQPVGEEVTEELCARPFSGTISQTRMIASFTGLISGRSEEEPDHDAVELVGASGEPEGEVTDLAGFERGIRAGVFLHEVLEHLDFQTPMQIEKLVAQKLVGHGIPGEAWRDALCARLNRLLETPLEPKLTLDRVSLTDRLSEVEFSYPISSIHPGQLQAVFAKHAGTSLPAEFPASLGRLQFRPVEGFMRGFIDLLFRFQGRYYIVDWKSNWLGDRPGDYGEPGIRACMLRHSYFLQYHLYTVATDLFLSRRIPGYTYDKDFGGVFYVFLRGIDPRKPERGIFRDRPDAALVSALRQLLGTGLL
jgi:exodeoxyribonuclease V beta subunit